MIKVLIVDDDNLVRRGIISAMPWRQFDMQVVGEASNGDKALEFLKTNAVDLLVTDLAMPVMSGIELMRAVHKLYPNLHVVVLTLHQDFDYIQEALRLGAIDFIVKVQLEQEKFEAVLDRIQNRIMQVEEKRNRVAQADSWLEQASADRGLALISKQDEPDTDWIYAAMKEIDADLIEADAAVWLNVQFGALERGYSKLLARMHKQSGWMLVKLEGIRGEKVKTIQRLLRKYRERGLFYEYDEQERIITKGLQQLSIDQKEWSEEETTALTKQWLSFNWIVEKDHFDALCDEVRRRQYSRIRIMNMLNAIAADWNRVYGAITHSRIIIPELFDTWQEARNWLADMRAGTVLNSDSYYSKDIVQSIMAAVNMIHEEMSEPLFAVDVAKRVNLSRSYFNQCFKEIIGQPFNEYLRSVRVDQAKEYLSQTNESIQWIAEKTGYSDVKYFSRIFRDATGKTPSMFRKRG